MTLAPTLQPIKEASVAGVKRDHLNQDNRLFFQGRTSFGAYLWSDSGLQTKAPASQGNIVISNGDRVTILSQNNGIVHVRIITNALDPADPKVIGATGYIYGSLPIRMCRCRPLRRQMQGNCGCAN